MEVKDEDEDGKRGVGKKWKREGEKSEKGVRMGTGKGTAAAAMKILYKEY